jgi:predicted esterase
MSLIAVTACLLTPLSPQEAAPTESAAFRAYRISWEQAEKAVMKGDYTRAAASYAEVAKLLPFEPSVRFRLACCHAQLGDKDRALASLAEAVARGWDDTKRLTSAEHLSGLRGEPRFGQIVEEAKACEREELILYAGRGVDRARPAPLVIVLQGLGAGPRAELPYWQPVADRLGLILAMPRAPTKAGSLLYGWHRSGAKDSKALDYFDLATATARIESARKAAEEKYAIHNARVALAGFSQGGGVALRLLADAPEKYVGGVAVAGLHQTHDAMQWHAAAHKKAVRVALAAGKLDRLLPRTQSAAEALRKAKVPVDYQEWEGVGHEYPTGYSERLIAMLAFVMDQKASAR